jgi:hypothetical protein
MGVWIDYLEIDGVNIPSWRTLKGIAGSPAPLVDTMAHARRHGVADYTRWYGPRIIEIDAVMSAADVATTWGSMEALTAAFALGTPHLLAFKRAGAAYDEQCQVTVTDTFAADVAYDTPNVVTWSVMVLASDPRFYSRTVTDAGVQTHGFFRLADVGGTFETPPVWTLVGKANAPSLFTVTDTVTGLVVSSFLPAALASHDVLVIDVGNRSVTLNGVDSPSSLGAGSLWADLPPSSVKVEWTGTAGFDAFATFDGAWRPARI